MGIDDERTGQDTRSGQEVDAHPVPTQQGSQPWFGHSTVENHDLAHSDHVPARQASAHNREQQVLARIDRARQRRIELTEERITLAHGSGGEDTRSLVEAIFLEGFRNRWLERLDDGADLTIGSPRLAFATDSFVVSPLFFPGGNIGDLAVNGTVNDLAVSGATPMYLSASFILEEGFGVEELRRVVDSMATSAASAGVQIVTGDTKVVQPGRADGCYITTTGVGVRETGHELGLDTVRPGDAVLVSGPVGDHGASVMLARGELDVDTDLISDTAALNGLVSGLLRSTTGVRVMRDATRGGVATFLNEIARTRGVAVNVDEERIPVRPEVVGAAEALGVDPLHVACEGRIVIVVDEGQASAALAALRAHPLGTESALIGRVAEGPPELVLVNTTAGGTRIVDPLVGNPLPRTC